MSKRRRSFRSTNWLGPIVIALAMGGIAYAVSDSGGTLFGNVPGPASTSTVSLIETAVSSSRFFVAIRKPEEKRDSKYIVDLGSKKVVGVEVHNGWRVEALNDMSGGLRVESSADRGFKLVDVGGWNVILRSASGEAYTEPRLLGKLDDKHAIVVARADRMQILDVSRVGQVIALADVPENAMILGFFGGAVWMATLTPGEGMESEPTGPSVLYKVTSNGERTVVDSTKSADFFAGAFSDGGRQVVWLNTGSFTAESVGQKFSGSGRPLAWLNGKLLVTEGKHLFLYDTQGKKQDLDVALDGEPAAARAVE